MHSKISFIHTADLHLGRSFEDLGQKGAGLRQRLLESLGRIVDLALDRQVYLVRVAGDLFDSPLPARSALTALAGGINRLDKAGIKFVIIPGTHDPPGSRVFSDPLFTNPHGPVIFLAPQAPIAYLEGLDLALAAWFPVRERPGEWIGPASGWRRDHAFAVALAHGSVLADRSREGHEDIIPSELLRHSEIHYLALGHHHSAGLAPGTSIPAYYSGAPEMLAFDQKGAGHALHVTLTRKGIVVDTEVDKVKVGRLHFQRLEVAAEEVAAGMDLDHELEKRSNPDLYLELVLTGLLPPLAGRPHLHELEQRHGHRFFKLRILDRTSPGRGEEEAHIAPGSVLAEFIRLVRARMESSAGPERQEWEDALRLGIHCLGGGKEER
jgi:DNA repair exonuclease SbcCD nuclease subunit